jgi:hypothetical protein
MTFQELQKAFHVLQYNKALDLQCVFNFCDLDRSNKLERSTWEAFGFFLPRAAMPQCATGGRFLRSIGKTSLPEAFQAMRDIACTNQKTNTRKSMFQGAVKTTALRSQLGAMQGEAAERLAEKNAVPRPQRQSRKSIGEHSRLSAASREASRSPPHAKGRRPSK